MDKTLYRRLAGIVPSAKKFLSEEKVDLSVEDILAYIDQTFYGERGFGGGGNCCYGPSFRLPLDRSPVEGEEKEPSTFDVVVSCLDALEKKGFDKSHLKALRDFFTKQVAADRAKDSAARAIGKLHSERWDRIDDTRITKLGSI